MINDFKNDSRWLIVVDLDGTLLMSKRDAKDPDQVNKENIIVLKKLIKLGHEVAIVTGRPWRDSEKIYKKLGLNTIIGNYNGAHIHHPIDKGFDDIRSTINRSLIHKILKETECGQHYNNVIIEFADETKILDSNDKDMMNLFHISKYGKRNVTKFKRGDKIEKNPYSITFRIDHHSVDIWELFTELRRKFIDSLLFRFWKDEELDMINLEINQKSITKGSAMKYIANYYNIPQEHTIAFGDGLNDIEMLTEARIGVAMRNAKGTVKTYAKDVTDFTNDEAGVARYLTHFFRYQLNQIDDKK